MLSSVGTTIGVVLVNWNSAQDTIAAAHSVLASEGVIPELAIVDNGSNDGSEERIRAALPTANLLVASTNRGYASGVNIGLSWFLGRKLEYVLVLNNDTTLDPNCIVRLVEALEQEPDAGVAGPLILYADEPRRVWYLADRQVRLFPVPISLGRGEIDQGQFSRTMIVDFVSGCALLMRRAVLEMVGMWDERLFMHYEDADFCSRTRRAGFEILAVPAARMWHKVSRSGRRLGPLITYYRTRNRVWFYAAHQSGIGRGYALAYVVSSELVRCVRALLTNDRHVADARWRGIVHGLRGQLGILDGK